MFWNLQTFLSMMAAMLKFMLIYDQIYYDAGWQIF